MELNDRIVEFLDKNRWVYSQDATAYCHVHKRECPAYPKYVFMHRDLYMPDARPTVIAVSPSQSAIFDQSRCSKSSGSDGWSHGCRLLKRRISTCSDDEIASKQQRVPTPWYTKLASAFEGLKPEHVIISTFAWFTCTDWTPLGTQRRGSGTHARHENVWLQERQQLAEWDLEDMYFTENADRHLVVETQVIKLSDSHLVVFIRTCPSRLGFPIRRKRTLSSGFAKDKWLWVGPSTPQKIDQEFH